MKPHLLRSLSTRLIAGLLLAGTNGVPSLAETSSIVPVAAASTSKKVDAKKLLAGLRVAEEPRTSTYQRSKFTHWNDADRDGCYARAEVLMQESSRPTKRRGWCTITTGKWVSLYDGKTVTQASKLEIDHVVPLAEAWWSGANRWSKKKREAHVV